MTRNSLTRLAAALLLAALPIAACSTAPAETGALEGASIGGPFTLTDQDGRRVSDTQFSGKYRLVYFGFTNCPNVCPVDLALAGQGLRRFEAQDAERAAKVQPLFITVDPERDTPAQMKAYVANFHPRLIGLTGTPAEIDRVKNEFRVFSQKGPMMPGGGYNVDHTRIMYLMGPDGRPIDMVPTDQGVDGVVAALDKWVR